LGKECKNTEIMNLKIRIIYKILILLGHFFPPQVLKRRFGKYYRMIEEHRIQQIQEQDELCRRNLIKYFEDTPDWVLPYFDSVWRMK